MYNNNDKILTIKEIFSISKKIYLANFKNMFSFLMPFIFMITTIEAFVILNILSSYAEYDIMDKIEAAVTTAEISQIMYGFLESGSGQQLVNNSFLLLAVYVFLAPLIKIGVINFCKNDIFNSENLEKVKSPEENLKHSRESIINIFANWKCLVKGYFMYHSIVLLLFTFTFVGGISCVYLYIFDYFVIFYDMKISKAFTSSLKLIFKECISYFSIIVLYGICFNFFAVMLLMIFMSMTNEIFLATIFQKVVTFFLSSYFYIVIGVWVNNKVCMNKLDENISAVS